MQRYFCNNQINNYYLLNEDDIYHITKVMRMKEKDCIEIVDNQKTYLCEIESLKPFKVKKIQIQEEDHESKVKVMIVQSLVKESKMDYLLQKSTELGAFCFYGYSAVNSIIKDSGKNDKKLVRWQKIVKEASEQSKRNIIPQVVDIIDLSRLITLKADLKILLTVNEKTINLKKILQENKNCDTMIVVIGPEGGFTQEEEQKLLGNGFIAVSLGERVLRSETASLATLAMINYEWMVE